jgi:hypothetical protein
MQVQFLDDAVRNDRAIAPFQMVCEARADITWYRIPGTGWTAPAVRQRIDEARSWFDRYCIHLNFEEFALDPAKAADRRIQRALDPLVREYIARVSRIPRAAAPPFEAQLDDVQASLLGIHREIARKVGARRLVVIFLDEWYVLVGVDEPSHWRQFRISGNEGQRLLVGIDRYDTDSPHILTHELTHALRKPVRSANAACIRKFVRTNRVAIHTLRPWQDHYSGANQAAAMTHVTRAVAFQPFNKDDSSVLTILEYLAILHGGYVETSDGCQCDKRVRRNEPRKRLRREQ